MTAVFDIEVSFSQISVFRAGLPDPFNFWSDQHVDQGFSWRKESVAFRTLLESGPHRVEVQFLSDLSEPPYNASRVIEVPFHIPDGRIEIASVSDGIQMAAESGHYVLRFSAMEITNDNRDLRLQFSRKTSAEFRVLRADGELRVNFPLLLDTVAA